MNGTNMEVTRNRNGQPPNSSTPYIATQRLGEKGLRGEGNARMANARASREAAPWRCRKHPKHRQSTGVCSRCLTKKLSKLSSRNYLRGSTGANRRHSCSTSPSSSSSLSSDYSSSGSSSCASPIHRHGRFAHEARSGPVSMLFGGKGALRKSRSVASAQKTGPAGDRAKGERSKGGFWSKLIPARRKRNDGAEGGGHDLMRLKHSSTQRERVAV